MAPPDRREDEISDPDPAEVDPTTNSAGAPAAVDDAPIDSSSDEGAAGDSRG